MRGVLDKITRNCFCSYVLRWRNHLVELPCSTAMRVCVVSATRTIVMSYACWRVVDVEEIG
jgi:hypothetical protein